MRKYLNIVNDLDHFDLVNLLRGLEHNFVKKWRDDTFPTILPVDPAMIYSPREFWKDAFWVKGSMNIKMVGLVQEYETDMEMLQKYVGRLNCVIQSTPQVTLWNQVRWIVIYLNVLCCVDDWLAKSL